MGTLKRNQQTEKKKNAQLLEEARKREDSFTDDASQLSVSVCLSVSMSACLSVHLFFTLYFIKLLCRPGTCGGGILVVTCFVLLPCFSCRCKLELSCCFVTCVLPS